jgi:hypothetical protein
MKINADPAYYHKMFGSRKLSKPRVVYYKRDFLDYSAMMVLSALITGLSYGFSHVLSFMGYALSAMMIVTFIIRHGVEFQVPVILKQPEEILYLCWYKLRNLKLVFFIVVSLFLLENLLIRVTPNLSHHTDWMRKGALTLFYTNLIGITVYRTISLIDHLMKRNMVREILMQTPWKRTIKEKTNIPLEIVHAYCTGVLSHIILLAPWYLVITHANFSILFLLPVCALDLIIQLNWMKVANSWFYRNHWLGHNSEFQFIYMHGTHHDAIPCGLIAVSENGFLEGFLRHTMGWPQPFYHPLIAFWFYTFDIKEDIDLHQYIPGIFPKLPKGSIELHQHSTHHYGPLEPYGFAFKLGETHYHSWIPDELRNAIKLDEQMGFKWDNPTFRRTKSLFDKYHDDTSKQESN